MKGSPRRRYYAGSDITRVQSLGDLRARTHRLMPRFVLEYLEGGAGEEATLARERESFAEWRVQPRTMVDVSNRSTDAPILGRNAPLSMCWAALDGLLWLSDRGVVDCDGAGFEQVRDTIRDAIFREGWNEASKARNSSVTRA